MGSPAPVGNSLVVFATRKAARTGSRAASNLAHRSLLGFLFHIYYLLIIMNVNIRLETQNDYELVEELTREAFWNLYRPGCDEHYLVYKMRNEPDFIKELAYVAEVDQVIVGSIFFTKSKILNENKQEIETVSFGPLCVHPDYQRKGIGTKLIDFTKRLVTEMGYPAIIILGDPHNYCKHGFKNCKDINLSYKDGKYPLGLLGYIIDKTILDQHQWTFYESELYEIDQDKVKQYDLKFKPKPLEEKYSQEIFSILVRAVIE